MADANVCGECRAAAMVGAPSFGKKKKKPTKEEAFLSKGTTQKIESYYEMHNITRNLLDLDPSECAVRGYGTYEDPDIRNQTIEYFSEGASFKEKKRGVPYIPFVVGVDPDRKNVQAEMTYNPNNTESLVLNFIRKKGNVNIPTSWHNSERAKKWIDFFETMRNKARRG